MPMFNKTMAVHFQIITYTFTFYYHLFSSFSCRY
jgi:hypothetical protein